MHKYLITVKCSFQNVRVCNHSVWFVTDSGGSAKMHFSQPGATWEVTEMEGWGGQCKIDSDACPCKDVGQSGKTIPAWAVDQWFLYKELGGDRTSQSFVLIVQPGVGGHPGPRTTTWRNQRRMGVGWGEDRDDLGQERSSSLSLLFEMMFVLWHSAASIVISHNIMGRLAPWPSGWPLIKGKKETLDLLSSFRNVPLPFYSVWPCFPCQPWYFSFIYMTLPLVTSSKCVFVKRRLAWKITPKLNASSQNLCLKAAPQLEVISICVNVGEGDSSQRKCHPSDEVGIMYIV